ncbi:MAG TPA: hypothetical protein DEA79_25710, partial [Cyanobacteria bacterium UBA11153]|nr:hypothetical protein [Cyanobacteria bacterium UBA11153]
GKSLPINADPALEAEADELGLKAAKGEQVTVAGTSANLQESAPTIAPIQGFGLLNKIKNAVKNKVKSGVKAVKSKVNAVGNKAKAAVKAVGNKVKAVKNKVKASVKAVKSKVKAGVKAVKNKVKTSVKAVKNKVKAGVKAVKNKVKASVKGDYANAALSGISAEIHRYNPDNGEPAGVEIYKPQDFPDKTGLPVNIACSIISQARFAPPA